MFSLNKARADSRLSHSSHPTRTRRRIVTCLPTPSLFYYCSCSSNPPAPAGASGVLSCCTAALVVSAYAWPLMTRSGIQTFIQTLIQTNQWACGKRCAGAAKRFMPNLLLYSLIL